MPRVKVDDREQATMLASLRQWQRTHAGVRYDDSAAALEEHIATDGGTLDPLNADEIDELCERINV